MLPVGKYLIIMGCHVAGTNATLGYGTFRITIDGNELANYQRQTFPVSSNVESAQMIGYFSTTTSSTHTINAQIFATVNFKINYNTYARIIKIG